MEKKFKLLVKFPTRGRKDLFFEVLDKYYEFLECLSCPDWKTEVQNWRDQPNYRLKIWPYTMNKSMTLQN